ncbi:MAG: MBL fold metallo-hydrolase [Gammaproteobacteria bacterium]|nr:MBL fold metallo-hydrolase [Gammaproteobacteria bacterium]
MSELLKLSSAIIDGQKTVSHHGQMNRINFQLSEIDNDLAIVEAFSHCIVLNTDDGLVAFDTSGPAGGPKVVKAIREWEKKPFNALIYTHGHIDHVGGCGAFIEDAKQANSQKPRVIGHENISKRFGRYRETNNFNMIINERQFGQFSRRGYDILDKKSFLPATSPEPNETYQERMNLKIGDTEINLTHARGETDDHTWAWIPDKKLICAGDFFIWCFPNAGNPQKVQRFPSEWARAMRAMAEQGAELFMPAHGLPIEGKDRIKRVLLEVAQALEFLVSETLSRMNEGATLDETIHEVKLNQATLEIPYLRPVYDEPEFVVRNIWRMYGGWYDGNPANLKPAPAADLANELASLSGGAKNLASRALELAQHQIRLACHLIEFAVMAEPENKIVHEIRAEIYQTRRDQESSLMSKGIFGSAANESKEKVT